MEKLDSFDFSKRPSRSRYAPVIDALVHDRNPAAAVRLTRGDEIWPADVNVDSVQGAIADQMRKIGKRAKTFRESDDSLVIGLNDKPAPKRARRREAVAA
jgi:uncharacterized protein related to proFAR isomerase